MASLTGAVPFSPFFRQDLVVTEPEAHLDNERIGILTFWNKRINCHHKLPDHGVNRFNTYYAWRVYIHSYTNNAQRMKENILNDEFISGNRDKRKTSLREELVGKPMESSRVQTFQTLFSLIESLP